LTNIMQKTEQISDSFDAGSIISPEDERDVRKGARRLGQYAAHLVFSAPDVGYEHKLFTMMSFSEEGDPRDSEHPEGSLEYWRDTLRRSDERRIIHANSEDVFERYLRAEKQKVLALEKTGLSREEALKRRDEELFAGLAKELIVQREDIPKSYWRSQEQIARDDGKELKIGEAEEEYLMGQLQEAQKTGLEVWTKYLAETGDQYPDWFKIYAWHGMSGLGVFDKKKGRFAKRTDGTVAPFPTLNSAALAKVYDLVSSGNKLEKSDFNTLYSRCLLDIKAVMKTPENPEEVMGEWREYTPDMIDELAAASEGTPWCVAGKEAARGYLGKPDAKFCLFHLQDPETGVVSPTAAASIRMENGRVAEISGLKTAEEGSNQALEDGVVPAVMKKVMTLPGGEKYLEAFEDKKRLITLDRMIREDPRAELSDEEISFIYELNRPIVYLDTYSEDPRPKEIREKQKGLNTERLRRLFFDGLEARLTPAYEGYAKLFGEAGDDARAVVPKGESRRAGGILSWFRRDKAGAAEVSADTVGEKTGMFETVKLELMNFAERLKGNGTADWLIEQLEGGVGFNLSLSPNRVLSKQEIFTLAKKFGEEQPYSTFVNEDFLSNYSDEELSGAVVGNSPIRFNLIPNKYNVKNAPADKQLEELQAIQSKAPSAKCQSTLDSIMNWFALRDSGATLSWDATYTRHFNLASLAAGEWAGRVPDSYVIDVGKPSLDRIGARYAYDGRVSVG
jgi:hypothetical protein